MAALNILKRALISQLCAIFTSFVYLQMVRIWLFKLIRKTLNKKRSAKLAFQRVTISVKKVMKNFTKYFYSRVITKEILLQPIIKILILKKNLIEHILFHLIPTRYSSYIDNNTPRFFFARSRAIFSSRTSFWNYFIENFLGTILKNVSLNDVTRNYL